MLHPGNLGGGQHHFPIPASLDRAGSPGTGLSPSGSPRPTPGFPQVRQAQGFPQNTPQAVAIHGWLDNSGSAADIRRPVGNNREMITLSADLLQTIAVIVTILVGFTSLAAFVSSGNKKSEERMSVRSAQLDKRLSGQITQLDEKLSAQITQLDAKIDRVDERLSAQINQLDAKLSSQIAQLDTKIDRVDERLSSQITQLDEKLSGQITQLDEKLSTRIDKVDERLSGQITQLDAKLSARIDKVDDRLRTVQIERGRESGLLERIVVAVEGPDAHDTRRHQSLLAVK